MSKKLTVLVGMTGGIDSTVAAYLLKKQGHKVIGIGIDFHKDPSLTKYKEMFKCHIHDLKKVKKLCDFLEIQFYGVDAKLDFKDKVLETVVSSKLSGQLCSTCLYCSRLLCSILLDKKELLEADKIATGHYAKVLYNFKTKEFVITRSNDLEYDQSYLLAKLEQKHLENLILPLSEARKIEISKIAHSLKIPFLERPEFDTDCFVKSEGVATFIKENIGEILLNPGSINTTKDETFIGDNDNIANFYLGQNHLVFKSSYQVDSSQVVTRIEENGNIFVGDIDTLKNTECILNFYTKDPNSDVSRPVTGYAQLNQDNEVTPVKVYFKNNRNVKVIFESEVIGPILGSTVVIYDKEGIGAKRLGEGVVKYVGYKAKLNRTSYKEDFPEDDEDFVVRFTKTLDRKF